MLPLSPFLRLASAAVVVLVLAAAATAAQAYQMSPMSLELGPRDRAATGTVRFLNDGAEPIAIQVRVARREVAPDGTESLAPDSGDIQVYPPQIVLQPGKGQTVRFKWTGAGDIAQEHSYRIVAEQLPVNLQRARTGGAQVDIMLRYLGTLYVVPEHGKAVVAARDARIDPDGFLRLTVRNSGNRHAILASPTLEVAENGQYRPLTASALGGMNGANVPAGKERHFAIPYAGLRPPGPVDVKFTFESNY